MICLALHLFLSIMGWYPPLLFKTALTLLIFQVWHYFSSEKCFSLLLAREFYIESWRLQYDLSRGLAVMADILSSRPLKVPIVKSPVIKSNEVSFPLNTRLLTTAECITALELGPIQGPVWNPEWGVLAISSRVACRKGCDSFGTTQRNPTVSNHH